MNHSQVFTTEGNIYSFFKIVIVLKVLKITHGPCESSEDGCIQNHLGSFEDRSGGSHRGKVWAQPNTVRTSRDLDTESLYVIVYVCVHKSRRGTGARWEGILAKWT